MASQYYIISTSTSCNGRSTSGKAALPRQLQTEWADPATIALTPTTATTAISATVPIAFATTATATTTTTTTTPVPYYFCVCS